MAVVKVLSVRDSAMQAYSRPIFAPSVQVAVRSFIQEVNRVDEANPMCTNPGDFELHELAEFDEERGVFHHFAEHPRCVARAVDHRKE